MSYLYTTRNYNLYFLGYEKNNNDDKEARNLLNGRWFTWKTGVSTDSSTTAGI